MFYTEERKTEQTIHCLCQTRSEREKVIKNQRNKMKKWTMLYHRRARTKKKDEEKLYRVGDRLMYMNNKGGF